MIIAVNPENAAWFRIAARVVLLLHIGGAGLGLVAGAAALALPKGRTVHRWVGKTFFGAMITMSVIGAVTAPLLPTPQWESSFVGLLTFYLVTTAWISIRRNTDGVRPVDIGAFLLASGITVALGSFGIHALFASGAARFFAVPDFVFGSIATLGATLDFRMIRRRGLHREQRVMRHLWRMCVALLIAAFSFFVGQQNVLPRAVHGSPVLLVPELAILATMLYWIVRSRRAQRDAAFLALAA